MGSLVAMGSFGGLSLSKQSSNSIN